MSDSINRQLIPKNSSASRFVVDSVKTDTGQNVVDNDVIGNDDKPSFEIGGTYVFDVQPESDDLDNASDGHQKTVKFTTSPVVDRTDSIDDTGHSTNNATTHGNVKSFRNVETIDKLPNVDYYRNIMSVAGAMASRPTLSELHEEHQADDIEMSPLADAELMGEIHNFELPESKKPTGPKFGWMKGVLVRCILNILGVMLYLRLSYITGNAGIGLTTVIILLSAVVTVLTTMSMCAICTNGEVKGGGAYFMISRSLGPEFGGSIGLIFALANAVGMAMYVVGFGETVAELLEDSGVVFTGSQLNDVRVIGIITAFLLFGVTLIGMSWEAKAQVGLLVILGISIIDYIIGTFLHVTDGRAQYGITGYKMSTFTDNFGPHFTENARGKTEDFFSLFALFFPAATGILAGANISGDLADAQKAIPKGTLLAIAITTVIYILFAWLCGATVLRETPNELLILLNDTALNGTTGLWNYKQMMRLQSAWGPLVIAGIFAATLSSALASLVSAPKVFQAVCQDKLFPYISIFARGFGKSGEPRLAYALAFVIALGMISIGTLDIIAPIISNFFLASYALINYATFDASLAHSPGFRPAFKYYNMWLSLLGAILCVAVMFVIDWPAALVTFACIAGLYVFIHYRNPDVNWGSSAQAHSYRGALASMLKLLHVEEHVKNFRPQVLCLTGNPTARLPLIDFISNVTRDNSLLICAQVVVQPQNQRNVSHLEKLTRCADEVFRQRKVKTFFQVISQPSLRQGIRTLMQASGLGKLRPNVLLMGYKNNWRCCDFNLVLEYFNIIHDIFDANLSLCILRAPHGLDFSDLFRQHNLHLQGSDVGPGPPELTPLVDVEVNGSSADLNNLKPMDTDNQYENNYSPQQTPVLSRKLLDASGGMASSDDERESGGGSRDTSHLFIQLADSRAETPEPMIGCSRKQEANVVPPRKPSSPSLLPNLNFTRTRRLSKTQKEILNSVNQFSRKIKKGTIDVWWLFDDGGLSLLIPYLLSLNKSYLEGARLRVFAISSSRSGLEQEQRKMAALLSKFRIAFADVFVIPDITKKPRPETLAEFDTLIEPYLVRDVITDSSDRDAVITDNSDKDLFVAEGMVSESELLAQKHKTHRHIRIRELLMQHSQAASLIVLTLPVPRKGSCSASLYMAWLDTLTSGLPPVLLVRGNQTSVLTFYS